MSEHIIASEPFVNIPNVILSNVIAKELWKHGQMVKIS